MLSYHGSGHDVTALKAKNPANVGGIFHAMPLFHNVMTSFRKPMFFHIYSIVAILIIIYFGVNLILGGIHAYN